MFIEARPKWATAAGIAVVAIAVGVAGYKVSAQQQPVCTPVLICPYPGGSGGTGGLGGFGGSGGRGGSGGTGGVSGGGSGGLGGVGGSGGVPADGLVVSASLKLDVSTIKVGQTLNGSVTYGNTSDVPLTVQTLTIATRAPGATHSGGPFTDLAPSLNNVTVPSRGSVTLQASRSFVATDTLGRWEAYSSYEDSSGWHDAPSVYFQVTASGGTGGGGGAGGTGGSGGTGGTGGSGGSGGSGGTTAKMTVGTQEWFIAGWAGTNIYKSGVNWATAYSSGTDIWNPQLITDLQGISTFRHMDTNAVNWSKITSWGQRKLPTDPANAEVYIDSSSPPSTTGMAVEWQIDLCNRANVDCWITHPYLADDNYLRQSATLIKQKLKPGLKLYIELSNEVWNGSFSAFNQSIQAGQALGLPGSNQYYQGIAHEMYRALQMYQIYEDIFGASEMGKRVIRVFAESGNLDLTTQALANVYKSSKWNPTSQKIDMMAVAPYIGNGTNGANETLARWNSEVDQKVNGEPIATAVTQNKNNGIPLLGCYEAGMHQLQSADVWAKNPQAYDGYIYMLTRFATKMNAPCNLYTLHGTWSSTGAWGLFNNIGQSLQDAPKARGTKDWIKSH